MQENNVIKTEIKIDKSPASVWKWLFNEKNIKNLVSFPVGAQLKSKGDGMYSGTVTLRNTVFETEIRPFEITMKASGRIFVIRIMQSGESTVAVMASFAPEGKGQYFSEQCMRSTLWRLKSLLEDPEAAAAGKNDGLYRYTQSSAVSSAETAPKTAERTNETPQDTRRVREKPSRPVLSWLVSLILLAVFITAFLKIPAFIGGIFSRGPESVSQSGLSDGVTLDNALKIEPGMTENDVKKMLGASGTKFRSGRVYSSSEINGNSGPSEKIYVEYSDGKASLITYVNTANSAVSLAVTETEPLYYEETVDEMELALCSHMSMYRCLPAENGTVTEYHFGYVGAASTFSPHCLGEYEVIKDSSDGSIRTVNYGKCDLSDPLEIDSLEGKPVACQYSNFDDFMLDRSYYRLALLMKNRYSKGDLKATFGEWEKYQGGGGLDFRKIISSETITGASGEQVPLWKMSFGLTSRGTFAIGSYVNNRLCSLENTLDSCTISNVAIGMTASEIRSYLPVLPSAVVVNENGYMLCYGKYLEKTAVTEQYEYILKFDLDERVNGIYDNSGMNATGSQMTSDPNAQTAEVNE